MSYTIERLTIAKARKLFLTKQISPKELTEEYFKRIKKLNPQLNAYITIAEDKALKQAAQLTTLSNDSQLLEGIPIALKDNLVTQDIRTTCGSLMLENFVPQYDGTTSLRLKNNGAIISGKLNMDEFGMGSSSEHSAFGCVKNPLDPTRSAGGSSGGCAAAVAANMCLAAIGTDTGGSLRQPASFCGLVGLRPTYGRVSRFGQIAFASSLDQTGPICKTVEDCAIVLSAISGFDEKDSTTSKNNDIDFTNIKKPPNLKIGYIKKHLQNETSEEVRILFENALKELEKLGHKIVEIELPNNSYSTAAYYILASSEASSNLSRYDGIRYGTSGNKFKDAPSLFKGNRSNGFGEEVKRRIMLGTYCLSKGYYDQFYQKAQKARLMIKQDYSLAFKTVDLIVSPTTPTTAFKLGEKLNDPLAMYLSDIYTISPALADLPALSLPSGFDKSGLPTGLQIIARPFDEHALLSLAKQYEQATAWHSSLQEVTNGV